MKLSEFKASLVPVGNSKAIIIPAKIREDYGVEDGTEYWVEIKLRKVESAE